MMNRILYNIAIFGEQQKIVNFLLSELGADVLENNDGSFQICKTYKSKFKGIDDIEMYSPSVTFDTDEDFDLNIIVLKINFYNGVMTNEILSVLKKYNLGMFFPFISDKVSSFEIGTQNGQIKYIDR